MTTSQVAASLLSLTLFLSSPISAQSPADCRTQLTAAQLFALQRVQSETDHYTVAIQTGVVDGVARTVVHLGEKHGKFEHDAELGHEVLKQFPAYGLEGVDLNRTWLGQIIGFPSRLARRILKTYDQMTGRPDVSVRERPDGTVVVQLTNAAATTSQRGSAEFLFYGRGTHGSTIDLAAREARSWQRRYLIRLERIAQEIDLDGPNAEKDSRYQIHFAGRVFSAQELKSEIEKTKGVIEKSPLDIPLEKDHQFSIAENAGSVLLPATLLACIYKLGEFALQAGETLSNGSAPTSPESLDALTQMAGVGAGLVMAYAGEKLLGRWDLGGRSLQWLTDQTLGRRRNQTMAQNVINAFRSHPELDVLLVITGRAHTEGIAQILQDRHDFERVSLP